MNAAPRVLVCYASAAGSTRGIAERIADRMRADLSRAGSGRPDVICRAAAADIDPEGFDALVIGSAVHGMAWLPEATSALVAVAGSSAPVWVFSVGSVEPAGPYTRMLVARERARIERAFPAGLAPRDHRVFRGIVDMSAVALWARLFWRLSGGRPGDHRNWPAVEEWAAGIATEVATRRAAPSPPATQATRGS